MVPAIPGRRVRLYPRVLNRHAVPDALLLHRDPEQLAHLVALCLSLAELQSLLRRETLVIDEAERLACVCHALVLLLEIGLLLVAEFELVELPCAVDGPVAEGAVAVKDCSQ